ncbi:MULTISPECIES: NAD(P)/FAD-dependent oxidoreductase [Burkholderiaceae]|uniref:Pyridine nucleotide-disulfide oxidoreductase n=1 Tax=Caballeronia zhejiangensis TaxID=871203 RepID=A0A656QCF8_9BURK|nr:MULTISPECIES: FAD-dependent oxidoreductase [Burkholderiaceae]KAK43831.1 pyridine nucleotide-disulfide oxidoreductase [Caballeronia jiangsuensis]KDR25880.1 pyridine nucleotide-disulfide oxidoreductase [Caballeronia zhejiangensis]SAL78339.1 FAD-dependent pyridine nucleotide-disulfide oxidoreductase [Caballeronia peredens]
MNEQLLIIGASYAGLQLAASARELGFEGRIDLLGDESYAPYQRPPLSKGYLSGAFTSERLPLKSNAFFEDQKIDLTRGARVTAIDRGSKTVELNDGSRRGYDFLGIATGARPRMLNCPGAAHEAVLYLRNLDDASRLVARMQDTKSAVVVGGGYIGLEVAASLRQKGIDVTVIEAQKNLLARVASASLASFVEGLHSEKGVSIQLGRTISEIRDDHGRARVTLSDGTTLTADLVVVGIGVEPNTELAQGCGLEVQRGILVDSFTRTSDSSIVAVGDCAAFVPYWDLQEGRPCRIESVQNANDMAKAAAAFIVGKPLPYHSVPWFWSDQYDVKLQMAGISSGHTDFAISGSVSDAKFSVFYFRDGKLCAVDSVNSPQDHMMARKMLAQGAELGVKHVEHPGFSLKEYAKSHPHDGAGAI